MARTSDNPVNHVISFRVNDKEKNELDKLASSSGVSISSLMRDLILSLGGNAVSNPCEIINHKDFARYFLK